MIRVDIRPELLSWACQRAGIPADVIAHRFPQFPAWVRQEARPTFKQVEQFAKATHTPVGYLFLAEPLEERVPIPDCRTVANKKVERPSPDLLDTIYLCQQRQEWYRDYARSLGEAPLPFVGSATVRSGVVEVARDIRQKLGLDIQERHKILTFAEALRLFIAQADSMGILVMCSGVVSSNNRRRLDPEEFRGFALSDGLAPLIFINGADSKSAQMFTLSHELAHIWLGETAVSDAQASTIAGNEIEQWCNRVAAELLVPIAAFSQEYQKGAGLDSELARLSRRFKVSTLVVLRRIHDVGGLTDAQFWKAYHAELERINALPKREGGGDFYLTTAARVSKRFARAVIANTLEGQTLHRDAFRMLGFSKIATFHELGRGLGVIV
ncbi:MAG: ImmA/IrrE family metallo-endopeptidase [Elusimicrobia bacterium]|nr:ImmA/IrrE family metallo-endopeptidase [Elusimicrobiota bacterium]